MVMSLWPRFFGPPCMSRPVKLCCVNKLGNSSSKFAYSSHRLHANTILLYGLECFQLGQVDRSSLDFTFNRLCMKLFKTGSIDVVKDCQSYFATDLPSCDLKRRQDKFILRYICFCVATEFSVNKDLYDESGTFLQDQLEVVCSQTSDQLIHDCSSAMHRRRPAYTAVPSFLVHLLSVALHSITEYQRYNSFVFRNTGIFCKMLNWRGSIPYIW